MCTVQKMKYLISPVGLFAAFLFVPNIGHAQLGVQAPMPKIKSEKSVDPSLDETLQWLSQKFEAMPPTKGVGDWKGHHHVHQNRIYFNKCDAIIFKESRKLNAAGNGYMEIPKDGGNDAFTTVHSISIAQVPLQEVGDINVSETEEIDDSGTQIAALQLSSVSRRKVFPYNFANNKSVTNKPFIDEQLKLISTSAEARLDYVQLYFPDIGVTHRIAKAFGHAVTLCRQKIGQERAIQPPKPKEIF